MPFPTIPVVVGSLTVLAAYRAYKRSKSSELTLERKQIYEAALSTLQDPDKLRKLAETFRKTGLKTEADMLEKRAELRSLPADVKAARRDVYRKAMASKNKDAVLQVATAFEKQGATGAAASLRAYAAGLIEADSDIVSGPNVEPEAELESETVIDSNEKVES